MGAVKADDLRKDREWRIVYDDAAVRVSGRREVCARPEWPQNFGTGDIGQRADELQYRVVDRLRRVAVVGGLLGLEFLDKSVIVLEHLLLGPLRRLGTGVAFWWGEQLELCFVHFVCWF